MTSSQFWERVGALADEAPGLSDLQHHKLQLIAGARMRARGERLPPALLAEERRAAMVTLATPSVLRRVRAACGGPVVLMKGAEVGARWPHRQLRPTIDIDLLVKDADAVQEALLAAGFVALYDPAQYGDLHHCCPLAHPALPVAVEVHRRPHWCDGTAPPVDEIIAAAGPCALGVDGILAPRPDHHAVLLAAHAWAHDPLDRIGRLADVAAMVGASSVEAATSIADRWGISAPWRVTMRTIDDLLLESSRRRRMPIWKRHLGAARERTVFESHVTRVVAPVAGTPLRRVPLVLARALSSVLQRAPDETWMLKARRAVQAVRHAAWSISKHEAAAESIGRSRD